MTTVSTEAALQRLMRAAEDVLEDAEAAEAEDALSGRPSSGSQALKELRMAINAVPGEALPPVDDTTTGATP